MKKLLILFMIVLFSSFVSAVQPQTIVSTGADGLTIVVPVATTIKQNNNFEFEIHVYNKTTGYPAVSYTHLTLPTTPYV